MFYSAQEKYHNTGEMTTEKIFCKLANNKAKNGVLRQTQKFD